MCTAHSAAGLGRGLFASFFSLFAFTGSSFAQSRGAEISGSRKTLTDGHGRYRIVDLRPGDYPVTFSSDGFRTTKREAITLTSSFTATVNAVGEVPLVDVQQSLSQIVVDHRKLDLIPTAEILLRLANRWRA